MGPETSSLYRNGRQVKGEVWAFLYTVIENLSNHLPQQKNLQGVLKTKTLKNQPRFYSIFKPHQVVGKITHDQDGENVLR